MLDPLQHFLSHSPPHRLASPQYSPTVSEGHALGQAHRANSCRRRGQYGPVATHSSSERAIAGIICLPAQNPITHLSPWNVRILCHQSNNNSQACQARQDRETIPYTASLQENLDPAWSPLSSRLRNQAIKAIDAAPPNLKRSQGSDPTSERPTASPRAWGIGLLAPSHWKIKCPPQAAHLPAPGTVSGLPSLGLNTRSCCSRCTVDVSCNLAGLQIPASTVL